MDNGIVLVARCEHDSVLQVPNGDLQFLTVKALNEWDSKVKEQINIIEYFYNKIEIKNLIL